MMRVWSFVVMAACAVICASLPVENMPVLEQMPPEIIFRDGKELVVECNTERRESGVTYKWMKNGQPFALNANVFQRDGQGTLVFKMPTVSDEGTYQCLAETGLGVASSKVTLKRAYIETPRTVVKTHKPVEGKAYKLDCEIPKSYPKPDIVWMYASISDPSVSRDILDRRIISSPEGDLYFTNVTKEDTSRNHKYVCVAKTPAVDGDVVLAEHILVDVVPNNGQVDHELVPLYVTKDFTAMGGSVTMIYCIFGGTPLAFPDWYKDGKNVNNDPKDRVTRYNRSSGKRLLIKETWLEDEGNYTCIADNELGKPQQHSMHLSVVSAAQFTERREQKMIIKSGQDVTVPCKTAGLPAPKVSWTHNTQELVQNDRVIIQQTSQGNITVADLTIKNVQKQDGGYYGCRGVNVHGEVYGETLIVVQ